MTHQAPPPFFFVWVGTEPNNNETLQSLLSYPLSLIYGLGLSIQSMQRIPDFVQHIL